MKTFFFRKERNYSLHPKKFQLKTRAEKNMFFFTKKRKGWYIKRTQIFNIFRFFGDFFEKKKKRNETDNETWQLIEEKGRDKTSCHDVLWSTRKKEENKEGIQKTKLQKHDKGKFLCKKKSPKKESDKNELLFFFWRQENRKEIFILQQKLPGAKNTKRKERTKKGPHQKKTPKKDRVQKRFKKSENSVKRPFA